MKRIDLFVAVSALLGSLSWVCAAEQDGSCSAAADHLDSASHKFISQCSDQTFCSGTQNGTCVPRQCRRDEFPFGYSVDSAPPPMCPSGTFCPDEGSGCRPLVPVEGACQLNRDEQCAPPMDWQDLASPQNFNGSICLTSTCMYVISSIDFSQLTSDWLVTLTSPSVSLASRIIPRIAILAQKGSSSRMS